MWKTYCIFRVEFLDIPPPSEWCPKLKKIWSTKASRVRLLLVDEAAFFGWSLGANPDRLRRSWPLTKNAGPGCEGWGSESSLHLIFFSTRVHLATQNFCLGYLWGRTLIGCEGRDHLTDKNCSGCEGWSVELPFPVPKGSQWSVGLGLRTHGARLRRFPLRRASEFVTPHGGSRGDSRNITQFHSWPTPFLESWKNGRTGGGLTTVESTFKGSKKKEVVTPQAKCYFHTCC